MIQNNTTQIEQAVLGIEFGSTRIKAVLIDHTASVLATGEYAWTNRLENGIWTYAEEEIWKGLQGAYADLKKKVEEQYGSKIHSVAAIGISAMMHGYIALGSDGKMLVPFRTWRNAITGQAASELSELFQFNIPERWSIAHLYQAILNKEEHVKDIAYLTTLAGYVHWKLTGEKVLGIGDASGMFPIDASGKNYDQEKLAKFRQVVRTKQEYPWDIEEILPRCYSAGENSGFLTEEGAGLLDPSGVLTAKIPMCPPEGDAGTGMVATNSVLEKTGNVSAGTSIFGMIVLEKPMNNYYREIDMVTTPDGSPVAMVHANNCCSEIDAWVGLFEDLLVQYGCQVDKNHLYNTVYRSALNGDAECGKLLPCGYVSGENITSVETGYPLLVRQADSRFNLSNLMKAQIFSSLATLRIGMELLMNQENIGIDKIYAHGGLFKTAGVAQKYLAAAMKTPIICMDHAGEGGAWGMAILALYMLDKDVFSLSEFLNHVVFKEVDSSTELPAEESEFDCFMQGFRRVIALEHTLNKTVS